MTARTERTPDPLILAINLPAKFAPAEARTIDAMRHHHPRASDAHLRDMIYQHGLILLHDTLAAGASIAHPARRDGNAELCGARRASERTPG